MLFNPKNFVKTNGSFVFSGGINASAHPCIDKDIIKEFWHNFTFGASSLSVSHSKEFIFSVGGTEKLPLDGYEYSINIDQNGFCVYAKTEKDLIRGVMTLLDRFKAIDGNDSLEIEVECCQIKDKALVKNRMIHFCVFPETEIWELQRFIRFCGALKYTHIMIEFWGTLKYDCMKELAWPFAFTKEQIKPIMKEARDLGLEIIPMFNHWGHASAGRVGHGKHVVLDQNPALQTYFCEDGWCWDIRKPKVRALLRKIRKELMDICGDSKYFHIGCDEAYNFEMTKENMDFICDFINEISAEMKDHGRKIIVWGDMFLYKYSTYKNIYTCNAPSPEVEKYLLDHLSREVIIADWQYDAKKAPIETCEVFLKAGFECLLCPWDRGEEEMNAALITIKEKALMGLLQTTWHTLSRGMRYVTIAAVGSFEDVGAGARQWARTYSAALMRKVMPSKGDYEKSGWSKFEVDYYW